MHLPGGFWASITYVVSFFSTSPLDEPGLEHQAPLALHPHVSHGVGDSKTIFEEPLAHEKGPVFTPPSASTHGEAAKFVCKYPKMAGWEPCSTRKDRTCWLKNKRTGEKYDIYRDYEKVAPVGIERTYELDATDGLAINADGLDFPLAKLFNRQYPGPWIQACWGDTITVKINNWMKVDGGNGTSIHWHGIRQLNTMHMDGVNGLTQCPIAPADSFTYSFKAHQYGTSWYHSHYSVQYADGLVGPLTLHGPTIIPYDEAIDPLLMTDWSHNSAFEAIQLSENQFRNASILLNGKGNATRYNSTTTPLKFTHDIPEPHTIYFDSKKINGRPRRYLLRLINTSFASSFIVTIDHHRMQVVTADFVPIHSYTTKSVMVAIGQRYHVIVEADPESYDDPEHPYTKEKNFWIRTYQAGCTDFEPVPKHGYSKVGILRYNGAPKKEPTTKRWPGIVKECADEYYEHLKPVHPWYVGDKPANDKHGIGENLTIFFDQQPSIFPLALSTLAGENESDFRPFDINYGDPTFLNLNYTGEWNPLSVVLPENYTDQWVYFVIYADNPHPIHLHGHDFAIIAFHENPPKKKHPKKHHPKKPKPRPVPDPKTYNLTNPPRRDVVMTPQNGGYVVIAFKTDNPGTWLMHCHIAFHASFGLALQFLERQSDAADLWPSHEKSHAIAEAQRGKTCPYGNEAAFPDSGI
ncbi:MAG: hypothetical protein Q9195_006071 [Heterodermia aff. obscurata]